MRIAYVTESFPLDVNGVAQTAVLVAEQLEADGHEPVVIAPEPAPGVPVPDGDFGFPVVRVPSVGVPMYPGFRVGVPGSRVVREAITGNGMDVVHLASPFVLGAGGLAAAVRAEVPVVALYETDMPGFARAYHTDVATFTGRAVGRAGQLCAGPVSSS